MRVHFHIKNIGQNLLTHELQVVDPSPNRHLTNKLWKNLLELRIVVLDQILIQQLNHLLLPQLKQLLPNP